MNYLFNYAKEKNVGIILWCVWHTLERQMDTALAQFEKWGVKGLKVDFMIVHPNSIIFTFCALTCNTESNRKMTKSTIFLIVLKNISMRLSLITHGR
jgi:alpha-glucosidase